MKKYTQADIDSAIQWHINVKYYKGYKCEAHNKPEWECNDKSCNTFHRIEVPATLEDAIESVNERIKLGINLTGYNDRPQKEWTY